MKLRELSRGLLSMTLGLATVLGGASAVKADSPASPGDVPRSTLAPADYKVVKCLHAMHGLDISAGQIAQTNGGTESVRDFGAMLVIDQSSGDQHLLAYAKRVGIDPKLMANEGTPNELARYRERVDQLRTLTGPSFDREFAETIRDGHARVISFIENARPDVSDSNLNTLLDLQLPTLKRNYEVAARLVAHQEAAASAPQRQPNTTSAGRPTQPAQPAPSTPP
jgi:predicted outer membrane protein